MGRRAEPCKNHYHADKQNIEHEPLITVGLKKKRSYSAARVSGGRGMSKCMFDVCGVQIGPHLASPTSARKLAGRGIMLSHPAGELSVPKPNT